MKVSVVIPCYNAADYLPNAVSSILKQRFDGTEIIVVDDKSSDNTLAVAEQLKQTTEHLTIIRQVPNGGPAKARNAGLRQAKGEYICFLDADDAYGDHLFATAIPFLDERPWIDALDFPLKLVNCHREVTEFQKRMMERAVPSNVIVRRCVALAVGGFPEGPSFRTKQAGEDVAFRWALREWASVFRLEGVFLEYTVKRGGHFDLFLDAMEGKNKLDFNAEDDATGINGIAQHLCIVRDQMRARAGISKTLVLKCTSGDRKFDFEVFANDASKQIAVEILTGKTYPKIPFINRVESVLDIGANIGASVIFFALNYPNAQIVGVEPARQPFVLLRRNIMNHPSVRIFNIGLHNVTTKRSMFLGGRDSVTNSILRNALSSNSQEEVQLVEAGTFTKSVGLHRPDLIKIDTEGCEIPIISSMIDSFHNAKAIYVEYHSEDDRLKIDHIFCNTHLLFSGKIPHPHRGELVYVRNDVFPSPDVRDRWRIADISHNLGELPRAVR